MRKNFSKKNRLHCRRGKGRLNPSRDNTKMEANTAEEGGGALDKMHKRDKKSPGVRLTPVGLDGQKKTLQSGAQVSPDCHQERREEHTHTHTHTHRWRSVRLLNSLPPNSVANTPDLAGSGLSLETEPARSARSSRVIRPSCFTRCKLR